MTSSVQPSAARRVISMAQRGPTTSSAVATRSGGNASGRCGARPSGFTIRRVLPTVWNGMSAGRSPRMTRTASAADWRAGVVVVARHRHDGAAVRLAGLEREDRQARARGGLLHASGNAAAVRLPGIWQMASGRRAASARLASGTSLLVLAGTSIERRGPPSCRPPRSRSRLNTEFTSAGTNSVPTALHRRHDAANHRDHVVVRRRHVDAGDVGQVIGVGLAGAGGVRARHVREDDGHAAAPAGAPPAASASRTSRSRSARSPSAASMSALTVAMSPCALRTVVT